MRVRRKYYENKIKRIESEERTNAKKKEAAN